MCWSLGVWQVYPEQTRTKGGCWWAAELPSACLPQLHPHCTCSSSKTCILGILFTLEMAFLKWMPTRPRIDIKHIATAANECSHTWERTWPSMFPVPLSGYCSWPCKNNLAWKITCPGTSLWQTRFIRWANFNCCALNSSLPPQTCVKGFRVYYVYPRKDTKADCKILVEVLHSKRLSFLLLALGCFPQKPLWATVLFRFLLMFPNVEGF